ncbi:MAG: DUF4183 domain-containing protein [Lawsonibacter sp.]
MEPITFPCYLSDQDGTAINPFAPNSILYKNLSGADHFGEQPFFLQTGEVQVYATAAILMEGYITVCACGNRFLRTVPFRSIQTVLLPFQPRDSLAFCTLGFCCKAKNLYNPTNPFSVFTEIQVYVESGVCPAKGSEDGGPLKTVFESRICIPYYLMPLPSRAYQYNATGDGEKRLFTDADQDSEYGYTEIPDPDSISFTRLFVNGVLQPEATYALRKGRLEFLTRDVPPDGVPITLLFVDMGCRNSPRVNVQTGYYVTASDGDRNSYTDEDAWKAYGCGGIPDPQDMSCWNLFVNGMLQPQDTYEIKKGCLRLHHVPAKGETILLESMRVLDALGRLLKGSVNQYVAYANGTHLFTNQDAIKAYHSSRIMPPMLSSYQTIFANGVIQPRAVYRVGNGRLTFVSSDTPDVGQPVTQQSTSIFQ